MSSSPVDLHCPHCGAFDWENYDGEEGWMIFLCRKCKRLFKIEWTER